MDNKCPSCGYRYIRQTKTVDEVVRYQSGKRKGEVKSIRRVPITFEIGHTPFHEIEIIASFKPCYTGIKTNSYDVLVCPECKTMIFNGELTD